MNKEKFLTELREYLSILENQEQEDILSEYSQHIDMKMQKGLSEEEAIRDFGSIRELAAEILEAYHVKPQFQKKSSVFRIPKWKRFMGRSVLGTKADAERDYQGSRTKTAGNYPGSEVTAVDNVSGAGEDMVRGLSCSKSGMQHGFSSTPADITGSSSWNSGDGRFENYDLGTGYPAIAEPAWKRICRKIRGIFAGIVQRIGWGFRWIGGKCRSFFFWCRKLFSGRKGEKDGADSESRMVQEEKKETEGRMRNCLRAMGRGVAAVWKWCAGVCIFGLKWMWNAAWLMFGLFCACITMAVLMGVGAVPVFIYQGYPFKGIFIICLGGLLCMGSLSCGAFSLLIRQKKDDAGTGSGLKKTDEMTEKSDKEATYEQTA